MIRTPKPVAIEIRYTDGAMGWDGDAIPCDLWWLDGEKFFKRMTEVCYHPPMAVITEAISGRCCPEGRVIAFQHPSNIRKIYHLRQWAHLAGMELNQDHTS